MSLRQLKQPICLFGEDADARRERLKKLTQEKHIEQKQTPPIPKPKEQDREENKLFYTIGCEELKGARTQIAFYSIPKACLRYISY